MSNNRGATFAKRQRELDQKDKAKEKKIKRAERSARKADGPVEVELPEHGAPPVALADIDVE